LSDNELIKRHIRSFVRREGRLTRRQATALDTLWSRYGMDHLDLSAFDRQAPVVLEIGFGMGGSLLEMAKVQSEVNFLGIEVHRPGVGALLADLAEHDIDNVRVMCEDASLVLAEIPDSSLAGINIFFPDPWHKNRHHKRRLIQSAFVHVLAQKLMPEGRLHLATDWEKYALISRLYFL